MQKFSQFGFTLVELSVVLIIIAAILGMTAVSGVSAISSARFSATNLKMAALNQALMAFRTANDRLPCPSDLSQTQGSATYGTEGTCTAIAGGVFVAQNASATATAAEGGMPTAALGLPYDFMYDGWGNRFRYAVDTKMTAINAFSLMQAGCVNGAITVYGGPNYPATGNTALTTGAIYALVSHGANGHGSVTKNATVYNAGSLNSDEQTNCHCTSTGAAGTYAPTYVQLAPYTYQAIGQANSNYNFDDIVSYKERWQMQTNWDRVGTNCAGGAFSRAINIQSSQVSQVNHTNLTNFPMLFSGTYSYLATTAHGGDVTNANGYDITFTSDSAGNDLLPFERESYNASTGQVVFWVNVPTVSGSANTTIYIWYDNPDITTDQSNASGTWNSNNYVGAWHSKETSGTTLADSTSNANNLNKTSATHPNPATGQIDGAQAYASGDVAAMSADAASLDFGASQDFTITAWVNSSQAAASGQYPNMVSKFNGSTTGWFLYLHSDTSYSGKWLFDIVVGSTYYQALGTSNIADGNWHFIAGVRSGSNVLCFQDGASCGSPVAASSSSVSVSTPFALGPKAAGSGFVGSIDEVTASATARSADWIKTEYNNQNSPSTFYTVGSAVSR